MPQVPALLASIFVCISFKWNVQKLVFLQQVLRSLDSYPTCVTVCIVTDGGAQLQQALSYWPTYRDAKICAQVHESQPYDLLWEHRQLMADAYQTGRYTAYFYGEDDQVVSWPAMESWAHDTEALQLTGHQRGFLRTEISQKTGKVVLLDLLHKRRREHSKQLQVSENLDTCKLVHAPDCCMLDNCDKSGYQTTPDVVFAPITTNQSCHHTYYIQPSRTFQGFWIATHHLLGKFIQSEWWSKQDAMSHTQLPTGDLVYYPDMTTWGVQFVHVPPGYDSALLVPWNPSTRSPEEVAEVKHLRNGYTAEANPQYAFGTIEFKDFLDDEAPSD